MRVLKIIGLLLLCWIISVPVWADDVTLSVCQQVNGTFQFAYSGTVQGWGFENASVYDMTKLTAQGENVRFFVIAYDGTAELSIWGNSDSPACHDTNHEWKASAPSILIPAVSAGPFLLDIQDAYGHWSRVTDHAHPDGIVLSPQNGFVELIGSVGQDTDPTHYRLIDVS